MKYNIGDTVKIVDGNHSWDRYEGMFKQFGFKDIKHNGSPKNGMIYTIFAIGEIPGYVAGYGIRNEYDNECLVNEDAFKPINIDDYSLTY